MKLRYKPWRHPFHPYCVNMDEVYKLHSTSRFGMNPDDPWYQIRDEVVYWIAQLAPVRVFGKETGAVLFQYSTNRFKAQFRARNGRAIIYPLPPCMWFARKSDVLLFKLAWSGM